MSTGKVGSATVTVLKIFTCADKDRLAMDLVEQEQSKGHLKKMVPLEFFRHTHSDAAREYPFMAKHTLLAQKLSYIPIRIPSGCVGKRHKWIFLKIITNKFLLTPIYKNIITESDGSPEASSTEAVLTLSPPKVYASPSAADAYNKSMPDNTKYSSLVASDMCDSSSKMHSAMANIGGGDGHFRRRHRSNLLATRYTRTI
jgi:hypothetical protein